MRAGCAILLLLAACNQEPAGPISVEKLYCSSDYSSTKVPGPTIFAGDFCPDVIKYFIGSKPNAKIISVVPLSEGGTTKQIMILYR